MSARLMILNGPNLNLLGVREPHIYGATTLASIEASCREFAQWLGVALEFHQSNHEGVLVDLIQSARAKADALIMNPAAYSFTSVALVDALKAFEGPFIEVHISNIHDRDERGRRKSEQRVRRVVPVVSFMRRQRRGDDVGGSHLMRDRLHRSGPAAPPRSAPVADGIMRTINLFTPSNG